MLGVNFILTMSLSPKAEVQALLASLPEDCTLEEIEYRIDLLKACHQGLSELDRGEGIASEDLFGEAENWR